MGRHTKAKDRLSRREGMDLFNKGAKLTRLTVTPGIHGPKGTRRAQSQYGRQLREKQKVKRFYGVRERQFKNYVNEAFRSRGNTGEKLFSLLERRLDNVIVRLGFANTRPQARQFVTHRHILVNGKKLNVPSYLVKKGDTIALDKKVTEIASVVSLLKNEDITIPSWLKRKAVVGNVVRLPMRDDVVEPFNEADIVEFYSR
jgi:small subunit ribosomal protein S4